MNAASVPLAQQYPSKQWRTGPRPLPAAPCPPEKRIQTGRRLSRPGAEQQEGAAARMYTASRGPGHLHGAVPLV